MIVKERFQYAKAEVLADCASIIFDKIIQLAS